MAPGRGTVEVFSGGSSLLGPMGGSNEGILYVGSRIELYPWSFPRVVQRGAPGLGHLEVLPWRGQCRCPLDGGSLVWLPPRGALQGSGRSHLKGYQEGVPWAELP